MLPGYPPFHAPHQLIWHPPLGEGANNLTWLDLSVTLFSCLYLTDLGYTVWKQLLASCSAGCGKEQSSGVVLPGYPPFCVSQRLNWNLPLWAEACFKHDPRGGGGEIFILTFWLLSQYLNPVWQQAHFDRRKAVGRDIFLNIQTLQPLLQNFKWRVLGLALQRKWPFVTFSFDFFFWLNGK